MASATKRSSTARGPASGGFCAAAMRCMAGLSGGGGVAPGTADRVATTVNARVVGNGGAGGALVGFEILVGSTKALDEGDGGTGKFRAVGLFEAATFLIIGERQQFFALEDDCIGGRLSAQNSRGEEEGALFPSERAITPFGWLKQAEEDEAEVKWG